MYHVELRQFPHVARAFNLEREELDRRFVGPWVAGAMVEHDDRRWAPERARLTIIEGPALRTDELGLGRGWARVSRTGADVTETIVAQARRGAEGRPEVEALSEAIAEVAAGGLSLRDAVALAAAAHPGWRPSQQLQLAEQAAWEMLHRGRLELWAGDEPIPREGWQAELLSWANWSGGGGAISFRAPGAPGASGAAGGGAA